MNRRGFIKKAGLAAATLLLPVNVFAKKALTDREKLAKIPVFKGKKYARIKFKDIKNEYILNEKIKQDFEIMDGSDEALLGVKDISDTNLAKYTGPAPTYTLSGKYLPKEYAAGVKIGPHTNSKKMEEGLCKAAYRTIRKLSEHYNTKKFAVRRWPEISRSKGKMSIYFRIFVFEKV